MLDYLRDRIKALQRSRVEPDKLKQLHADLSDESLLNASYLILTVSSCAIATLGLLTNSAAVIIGAMLIAPLMLPIRGLAYGALQGNIALFRQGVAAIAVGTFLSIAIAYSIGILVRIPAYGSEVLARSAPNLLDLGIAVAAGSISGYAKVDPKVSASLAGTAIAVALMPPVSVIGWDNGLYSPAADPAGHQLCSPSATSSPRSEFATGPAESDSYLSAFGTPCK